MDPFLDYAVWLTINELASPWLDAVQSGAWRIAGREKQLEFGLKAVEPALAAGAVAQLVSRQGIPLTAPGRGSN